MVEKYEVTYSFCMYYSTASCWNARATSYLRIGEGTARLLNCSLENYMLTNLFYDDRNEFVESFTNTLEHDHAKGYPEACVHDAEAFSTHGGRCAVSITSKDQ